jgi:ERCC4-type nuclease
MFLTVSDYVLSDDIQIERKQVSTYDLHNSLRSGRLESQLKNMSAKIKYPYLLIEFSNKINFSPKHLMESYNRVTN